MKITNAFYAVLAFAACGLLLSGWLLIRTFQEPLTVLSVLSGAIQFLSYLAMLIYALFTYKKEGDAPFQGVVLA